MTNDSRLSLTEQPPSAPNSARSLAERLKAKTQQEVIAIREQTQNELQLLNERLSELSSAALNTTNDAIASHTEKVKSALGKTTTTLSEQQQALRDAMSVQTKHLLWLMKLPLLLLLAACLLVCGMTWAWAQYQLAQAEKNQVQSLDFKALADREWKTYKQLEAQTWGLTLHEDSSGRWVIFPPKVEPSTGYNVGQRQAVRLGKK